jgi:hypothetical protein
MLLAVPRSGADQPCLLVPAPAVTTQVDGSMAKPKYWPGRPPVMLRSDWRSDSSALKRPFTLVGSSPNLARSWYLRKLGMAMAARMPMIATTIMSSIRVKPFIIFFFMVSSPR